MSARKGVALHRPIICETGQQILAKQGCAGMGITQVCMYMIEVHNTTYTHTLLSFVTANNDV